MPYKVVKDEAACSASKPWACKNANTDEVMGCHATKKDAEAQMRALYANEPNARVRAGDRPAVRTVPNVEIMEVGTWPAMTGPVSWSSEDLAAAVAAFDDPGYNRPIVKVGHIDPRFDGQPALGRLGNPRLSDDKQTMIVDLLGVPTWLADLLDSTAAFPGRSVEGTFGMTTPTGTKHRFALTALSLLGVAAPAVSTLADVALLYGLDPVEVAAATPGPEEEPMPTQGEVEVAASVSLDQVRQSFYTSPLLENLGPWAWVREVYNDSVIVDDDSGNLFRVPWSEGEGKTVTFGEPARVTVDYVDTPAPEPQQTAASQGALHAAFAARTVTPIPTSAGEPPAPKTPAAPEPSGQTQKEGGPVAFTLNDDQAKALRKRLGLAEDATDEDVAAALAAEAPPGESQHTAAGGARTVPKGAVVVDADSYAELQAMAARGDEAARRLANADRDQVLEIAATVEGKFPRSRIDHWKSLWDKDPEGTRAYIAAMAKNVVPVSPRGYTGDPDDEEFDAEFAHIFPPKEA